MLLIVSLAVPVAAIPPPDTSWNPPSETPSVKSGEPSGTPSITIPTQNVYYEYGGEEWEKVYSVVSGNIGFWVQYGPAWGLKSAVYLGNTVRTAIYNDQYQYLYWVEIYPDGKWRYWGLGYHNSGWIMRYRFLGDAPGWHKIFIYGSKSGYSNPIWVYVWSNSPSPGPQPQPTPTPQPSSLSLNAWMTKTTYYVGESIDMYYSVNMPANVKITTYTPYGSQIISKYVGSGTHYQHIGTAGSITGWRQVKVEAWANGQHRVVWLNYNVQYPYQYEEPNPPPIPEEQPPIPPW